MAVGSLNNKIKGNNAKNKRKNTSSKRIRRSKRYEIINDLSIELEKLIIIKELEIINKKKRKTRIILLLVLFSLLVLLFSYLIFPRIELDGDKEITINYDIKYNEPGYKGSIFFKDVSNKIKIDNSIIDGKVGKYKIEYLLDYKLIKIKKERIVNIVDLVDPIIDTQTDILKVCPKEDNPQVKYKASDEYDGDITDKVIQEYNNDKIILSVSDNANNYYKTEVKVVKQDTEAPKLTLKGNSNIYLNIGSKYTEPGYTAIDNCDGDITNKVEIIGNVGSTAGVYKITYTVLDDALNKSEVTRTVTVRNNTLYNNGSIGNGVVYLTFDDGPREGTTNVILDILKEEGIKATFFVTCNGPNYLIKRIYNEGHTVALHTCTHDYAKVYSSVDNYFNDLNRVSNRVKNITGFDAKIIRFPGGSSNTISRNYSYGIMTTLTGMVLDRGYRYYDWNVDSKDAGGANNSYQVYNNVINALSYNRSNVVLMHDVKVQTRDALRIIIHYAKDNGYTFSKIDMDTYMVRHRVNN